jgi:hypothetical protein
MNSRRRVNSTVVRTFSNSPGDLEPMEPESQPLQPPDGAEPAVASVVADRAETSDWAEPTETSSDSRAASWCDLISGIFILAALIFGGVGLYTMYDNSYSSRIVGGDAYNFIIYATRGTAFICAGIICAVLSVAFALFGRTARGK